MPGLVQLQQVHPDEIICVSVSLDYDVDDLESAKEEVLDVLKSKNLTVRNTIQSDPDYDVQKELMMTIPIVLVYDQMGERVHAFHNGKGEYGDGFTYDDHVIPAVEKLLLPAE